MATTTPVPPVAQPPDEPHDKARLAAGSALRFVVLMGFVSMLADMTYEGSRGITGPYLGLLGASAMVVSTVAGAGDMIGWALRLITGYVTDRTEQYWLMTFLGYGTNTVAVPMMALTGRWEWAAALIIMERTGKALRAPARDAMLSHATKAMGRGKGFGLHKAMDQTGALLGPLMMAAVLYFKTDNSAAAYRFGFAILLVPALAALLVLATARFLYPNPHHLEVRRVELESKGFALPYWIYLAGVALIAAGYADYPLIAFHFKQVGLVSDKWIPLSYSLAMGIEAVAALVCGRFFDRIGFTTLIVAAVLSSLFAPLVFFGGLDLALVGVMLWGLGKGAQESIMKAAVADMAPPDRRGSAYGVFNTGYGVSWFLGSALIGFLYTHSLLALVAFSVLTQLAAVPLFMWVRRRTNGDTESI